MLKSLKEAGIKAVPMVNFKGEERANRVFLAAWILDKEEQNLIAGLGASSCTACHAETKDLGDSSPQQVRYIITDLVLGTFCTEINFPSSHVLQRISSNVLPMSKKKWILQKTLGSS